MRDPTRSDPPFSRSEPRAYRQEWVFLEKAGNWLQSSPVTNTLFSFLEAQRRVGISARLSYGRISDAVAGMNSYKVILEPGWPPITCTVLSSSSHAPIGARAVHTLVPGSAVWVIWHPQMQHGVIVGVEPDPDIGQPRILLPEINYLGSRCGIQVDSMHNVVDTFPDGATPSWFGGRPLDSTTAGEWGGITESGLRILLDSGMAQLAASEATGVFAFLWDQLLRLAGYNWQSFSCGHEEEILNDEGEIYNYRGLAVYPWEQLGISSVDMQAFIEQESSEGRGPVEPNSDRQQAIHRSLLFGGYLGQGGKRILAVPEPNSRHEYSQPIKMEGVFEENLALTGRYSIRSAHSVLICRRPGIPVPRRNERPENTDADNQDNYRPSGLYGSGEEHKVVDGPKPSYDEDPAGQMAAAVDDIQAYAFNWEGLHPFHYHKQDWEIDEEEDMELKPELPNGNYPQQKSLPVDHRYGEALYALNTSYVSLLPDGGVVIGDGYGAEIKMVNGSIYITAPNDLVIQTGRNLNVFSGRDCNVKAYESCEVVANRGDLRLKAENNCHVLAGNSGGGGILLESRSPSAYSYDVDDDNAAFSGGIQIKSSKGGVDIWGETMYLRTWSESSSAGPIVLDADKGKAAIVTNSDTFLRYSNFYQDGIGRRGNITDVHSFGPGVSTFSVPVVVDGHMAVNGGAIFKGFVNILEGHIGTELSGRYDGLVGVLKDQSLQRTREAMNQNLDALKSDLESSKENYQNFLDKFYYQSDRPGDDALIEKVGFTFRSSKLYGTEDNFKLWETRWQRLMGQGVWKENPVRVPGAASGGESTLTYAYPGRKAWTEDGEYLVQPTKFSQNGVAVKRGSTYEDAELEKPTKMKPSEGYKLR